MADDANKEGATPPAQSGVDVAKIVSEAVAKATEAATAAVTAALKPVAEQVAGLAGQVGELGKAKQPAAEGAKKDEPLSAEAIAKLVSDGITGALAKRQEGEAAAAKKAAARSKVMAAKGLDKLPASIVNLPDSDDEAALTAAADKLVADLNASGVKLPDVGGAAKDGGKSGQDAGAGKPGGFLKMPGAGAAA